MNHHRIAAIVVVAAAGLDVAMGLLYAMAEHISEPLGLYWAVATATTVGYGDVTPKSAWGHVIAVIVMVTVVPLFGATFSLFTSGLTASHVARSERRMRKHVDDQLADHGRAMRKLISGEAGRG